MSQNNKANVTASINKEKSIVYPTHPHSVLQEFQSKVQISNRHQKSEASLNPFDSLSESQNVQDITAHAPLPVENFQQKIPVVNYSTNVDVPARGVGTYVPRIDLSKESSGILSRTVDYDKSSAPKRSQTDAVPDEIEVQQLKGILKGCIATRTQQANSVPLTLGELSGEIKIKTGHSWGGYWAVKYGPLDGFLRRHRDTFSVLRNKYVVLAGTEDQLNIPDTSRKDDSHFQQESIQPSVGRGQASNIPLNLLAQQQSNQGQQEPRMSNLVYQGNYNPYDNYAYEQNMQNPFFQDTTQRVLHRDNAGPQNEHFLWDNPYQQDSSWQVPVEQKQLQPSIPWETNLDTNVGSDLQASDLDMFQLGSKDANSFDINLKTDTTIDDSFWRMDKNEDMNPLAVFESEPYKLVEEKQKEEAKRKQQEADEAYARRLQDEEYAKAKTSTESKQKEYRIVLSANELREMAENEIGKDNVRIMAGFSVIKYGREGRPHQRKMWVNSSLTHLAWESGQYDGSHRGLELAKVSSIRVGEMTKTIARSTKDYKKVRNLCFSLETSQRTLDLQACSIIQRDSLVAALRKVVEFNRKHKPIRKDKFRTEITVCAT